MSTRLPSASTKCGEDILSAVEALIGRLPFSLTKTETDTSPSDVPSRHRNNQSVGMYQYSTHGDMALAKPAPLAVVGVPNPAKKA